MSRFLDNLRRIRQEADGDRAARQQEEAAERQRELDRHRLVDEAAEALEAHVEQRLKELHEEFMEFRFEAYTDEGRQMRMTFNEPPSAGGPREERLHQLAFRVRRHHKYADVELEAKLIVANSERARRLREEDVFEGDPPKLHAFVDELVLKFSKTYLENRGW